MGITASTAARIYKGQREGKSGEEGYLKWERFPHMGLMKVRIGCNNFNDLKVKKCVINL